MDQLIYCSECNKPLSEEEVFILENQGLKIPPEDIVCFLGENNCQNKIMLAGIEKRMK